MTADIYETTAQLAALWPALAAALARDTATADGPAASTWTAAQLVNADVLAAAVILAGEIPAACHAACDLLGERWQYRKPGTCLRALPRLASRMDTAGHPREARMLERQAAGWLRVTKRALGLQKPDIPVGPCPYAASLPEQHAEAWMLYMAGAEGRLRDGPGGVQVVWTAKELIYCAGDCGSQWPKEQWNWLERMLRSQHAAAS